MKQSSQAALFIAWLICFAIGCITAGAQTVTFVQLTDVHLFDSGKHRTQQAGFEDYLNNRSSLEWAVIQTNNLAAEGKCIDFVAFTGDFGLEDADPTLAAQDIAVFFRALAIKRIFLVPGNNDLKDENPRDLPRYQTFVDQLARLLPDHELIDLTRTTQTVNGIHIVGLNSASFKNDNGKANLANQTTQQKELQRVTTLLQSDQPTIIFTHIPNLEDPFRGDQGEVRRAWNLAHDIQKLWDRLVEKDDLIGVFAGHFHDARRTIYMHDYGWAQNKPRRGEGTKTWIAPPLAVKFQAGAKPQARGLLLVTASAGGATTAVPIWFGETATQASPDKAGFLLQAKAEANHGYWNRALSFYSQALTSTDPGVMAHAEQGYLNAREQMHLHHLIFRAVWLAIFLLLLLTVWFVGVRNHRRQSLIIETPSQMTTGAPVDLFAAAVVGAVRQVQEIYHNEEQRGSNPFVGLPSKESGQTEAALLSGGEKIFQTIAGVIPDIRGVKVGTLVQSFPAAWRWICHWRVTSGLAVYADGSVSAFLAIHWRGRTVHSWVESVNGGFTAPDNEAPNAASIEELAWRVANDLVSRNLVR